MDLEKLAGVRERGSRGPKETDEEGELTLSPSLSLSPAPAGLAGAQTPTGAA